MKQLFVLNNGVSFKIVRNDKKRSKPSYYYQFEPFSIPCMKVPTATHTNRRCNVIVSPRTSSGSALTSLRTRAYVSSHMLAPLISSAACLLLPNVSSVRCFLSMAESASGSDLLWSLAYYKLEV